MAIYVYLFLGLKNEDLQKSNGSKNVEPSRVSVRVQFTRPSESLRRATQTQIVLKH